MTTEDAETNGAAFVTRALLDEVRRIANDASERILPIYHSPFEVERKADASLLTEADLASHRLIIERLEALTPELPILSEESADIDFATRARWERYWLVDPLDGTRDFVNRNGEFTVNIALIEHHAPVLGVVTVPVSGVAYAAARGLGAHRHAPDGGATPLAVQKPAVPPFRVAASRSHADPTTEAFIRNLGPTQRISIGSSLKFCLVAEGEIDVYPRFGPTSEWDTAAAQCVVEQAGGEVTDTLLKPLRYNTKESLLNPFFLVFGHRGAGWEQFIPPEALDGDR